MRRHGNIMAASFIALSAALLGLSCGSDNGSTNPACAALTSYTPTSTTPVSFATTVYPILAKTSAMGGCSDAGACHGNPAIPFTPSQTRKLQFVFDPPDPAMAKAQLLTASVHAPTMPNVVPNNVGGSFLAYKISGQEGLDCAKNKCVMGATTSPALCGAPMPNVGTISDADRTTILDWIATGAAD